MRALAVVGVALAAIGANGMTKAASLPHFTQPNAIWNEDVSNATPRANSALMVQHLEDLATANRGGTPCYNSGTNSGCWGGDGANSNHNFQIDLSMYVLHADGSTPTKPVVAYPSSGQYYAPDCDAPGVQTQFPLPPGGGIEGTVPPSYTCDTNNNDCHLLVADDAAQVLYEAYYVNAADATGIHTICALKWDLTRVYPRYGRGEHCTSADGAGFPIAPLLFNADEVWAAAQVNGDLGHAIRFILGNSRMMNDMYVHPASHGTLSTSDTNVNAVPYGSHLRLKASFPLAGYNAAAQVILRTLQKYGMFLSDGGGIPLTGEADDFDTHKWSDPDMAFDSHSLFGVRPTDFDVIEAGDPMTVTYDCVRTPEDFLFIDGYDF